MKKILMMVAAAMMAVMNVSAQRLQVVDSDGQGIPLVSILTEDGNYIGKTDLDGVIADVKGAAKVALTHVAYKPQLVTVASLPNGRVVMEDLNFGIAEIVITPKPFIYVEDFYRVYVYRNDSLCFFRSGIMPNAYDPKKKKLEQGSYYQAYVEHCQKMGPAATWFVRSKDLGAGKVAIGSLQKIEEQMKDKYYVKTAEKGANHKTYSNQKGTVGQLVSTGNQIRMTLDAGKMQMHANQVKGEKKLLEKRKEMDYDYQYTRIYADNEEKDYDITSFIMESDHWEYNDKKSHVKFIIENYATDHYYMNKDEWKAKKKEMKETYGSSVSLDKVEEYATSHNIPALSSSTRQAIKKLRQW
jgi:hypothetical protein